MLVHEELTKKIIGAAIRVHAELGPGLLEAIYEECLAEEMACAGLAFERQLRMPIHYRGKLLSGHYRMDFLVEDSVVVELKAVDHLDTLHRAQLLSYLRLSAKPVGLLLNFHSPTLSRGIIRVANTQHI